jgi:hypothetical protein
MDSLTQCSKTRGGQVKVNKTRAQFSGKLFEVVAKADSRSKSKEKERTMRKVEFSRRSLSKLSILCAFLISSFISTSPLYAQATWNGGSGNWSDKTKWSTGQVPNGNVNVAIDGGKLAASPVTLDTTAAVNNITIDVDDSLTGIGTAVLTVNGTSINSAGTMTFTQSSGLGIGPMTTVTLSGGGTLTLSTSNNSICACGASGSALVNQNTIQGVGAVGKGTLALNNRGTINANVSGGTLVVQPSSTGLTNSGTMEATNGGMLQISSGFANTPFNNSGGTIEASNGSTVRLSGAIWTGGKLTTSGTGVFQVFAGNSTTLDNLTNAGNFQVLSAGTLTLGGTINNTGTISLNSTGSGTDLLINGAVTLKGGGTLAMLNNQDNFIVDKGAPAQLINQETIQGAGTIGSNSLTVTNQGTMNANATSNHLILAGGAAANTGTMEATGGGTLEIRNTVNNAGGTIQALTGSTVLLSGGTVAGGTVTSTGTGSVQSVNGTLDGTANIVATSGSLQVNGGSGLTIKGTVNNTGAISLSGNLSNVSVGASTATLQGTGTLTLGNGTSITGLAGSTLINKSTIQGTGNVGGNVIGVSNSGVIDANVAGGTLTIQSGGSGVTNTGTMEATNGGTLSLLSNTFANTGGTISAQNASTVVLNGANIVGGTLTSAGTGILESGVLGSSFPTLNGVTNTGTFQFANGTTTKLAGSISNAGNLFLNSTGFSTLLELNGNVTLKGNGKLTLSNNSHNLIQGASTGNEILTNASTIQGSGNIGGNFMGLINTGTLIANQSNPLIINPDGNGFNNKGKLQVGTGDTLQIVGPANSFLNFSGTQLTGGSYSVVGTFQFNGANIVTNAANISLIGAGSKIVDQTGITDGLRNFANNSASGSFSITGGRNFTTAGGFTNAGTFSIGTGSTFTLGGPGSFTQASGKTTDDGTLSAAGTVTLLGGSLFGKGTIAGALQSSGTITPGDSSTSTGALAITKTYTQNSAGVLDISIGGNVAGTKYDQLNIASSAKLNGTLNLSRINGFVPAIGTTFEILNAGAVSGSFSTVNGTHINGSEHFVVSCDTTDCDVTVASGPSSILTQPNLAAASTYSTVLPGVRTQTRLGFGSQAMRGNLNSNFIRTYAAMLRRSVLQNHGSPLVGVRVPEVAAFRTSIPPIHNFARLQASFGAESSFLALHSLKPVFDPLGRKALSLNANAAFKTVSKFTAGMTPYNFFRPGLNGLVRRGGSSAPAGRPMNARALGRNRVEYGVNLLSILGMSRWPNRGPRLGSQDTGFGYLAVTNSY